jgi:hypothetical protein
MPPLPKRSIECKEGRHNDCPGRVERLNWNEHDRECECRCHLKGGDRWYEKEKKLIAKENEDPT